MDSRRLLSALLSVSLLLSTVAVPAAAAAGPPSGLDAVPASNVGPPGHAGAPPGAGPPDHAGPKGELGPPPASVPTDAAAWGVRADRHAADLTVEVGETADGRLALRLGDAVNHEGRTVAVDAETLREALGYRPEVVSGLHESGDRWTANLRYEDGYALFSVPQFSTNTVTFDADVAIEAAPAESGDTFRYDVADSDAVANLSIELTGSTHRETLSTTATASNGSTIALDVGGTSAPENATLTVTGRSTYADASYLFDYTEHVQRGQEVEEMGGVIYSAAEGGNVTAYDLATDSVLWKVTPTAAGGVFGLEAENGTVYVGSDNEDGRVYALDPADGSVVWSSDEHLGTYVWGLELDAGTLYTGANDGDVAALDASTGSTDWTATPHGAGNRSKALTVLDGVVYSGSYETSVGVAALDAADGSTLWTEATEAQVMSLDVAPDRASGGVLYWGNADGRTVAYDVANRSEAWNHTEHGTETVEALLYEGGVLYSGSMGNETLAYDVEGRSVLWSVTPPETDAIRDLAYRDGVLYLMGWHTPAVAAYEAEAVTEDVAVDLDGTTVLTHSGVLSEGETVTETVNLSTSSSELAVSLAAGTEADVNLTRTEVTETVDPEVDVNGHVVGYTGTLADGETAALNVSDYWIETGSNNVTVRASTLADGPVGMVGLSYRHEATEARSVSYGATVWSESYDVSKTYASDVESAVLRVPWASDRVLSVRSLAVTRNGSEVASPTYASTNGTLTVELGSVAAGETVNVSAIGSKVRASGGTIAVVDATETGHSLDSKVRVEEVTDPENLTIAVEGTGSGHLLHYTAAESWDAATDYATAHPDGGQDLHTDAPAGATFRVRTIPVELRPSDVPIEALVVEASDSSPRFRVREAAGHPEAEEVEVTYYATTEGESYELYDVEAEMQVDTGTASSPVSFLTDGDTTTYLIELWDSPNAPGDGSAAVAVAGGSGGGSGLAPAAVILAAAIAVVGVVLVGRRFGVTGRGRTVLLGTVAIVVAVVAVEAVTRGSVLALLAEAVLDPLVDSQVGVIGGGIGLLLGVWAVHDWIGLPWWVLGLAVAGDAVWVLDTITEGALGGGLGEVSALLWLVGILGGLALLYRRLAPRDIVIRQ